MHRRRSQEPKSAKRQTRGYAGSKTLPPHESRSLPELQKHKLPKVTINGKSDALCGRAHMAGYECTKPTCPFAHAATLQDITGGMAALVAYEKAEASVAWEPKIKAAAVKQAAD